MTNKTQLPIMTTAELRAKNDAIDASHRVDDSTRRVAKRRALRLLFNEYGLGCLSIQLGTMDTEQLNAMAKLMGSYQTISAM